MMDTDQVTRRQTLRAILRSERVGTQEELVERLFERGFDVTQATLSRDLAKLRARRAVLPEGGTVYEVDGGGASADGEAVLGALRKLVVSVEHNDSMVVLVTTPGGASAVAQAIDRSHFPSVLGTIAGDDTIFVAPAKKSSAAALSKQLLTLWRAR